MAKRPARPRDPNQLAKLILDMATGDVMNDSSKAPDTATIQARRIHKTLRVTPAMEAGMADHFWELDEIANLSA